MMYMSFYMILYEEVKYFLSHYFVPPAFFMHVMSIAPSGLVMLLIPFFASDFIMELARG